MQTFSFSLSHLAQKKYLRWLFIIVFLVGLFFRASYPSTYPLSFDQLLILEHGQKILGGDLIVLGPKTGPAFLFIGPLTYYLGAFALMLTHGSAYALVTYSIMTYIMTSILLYLVLKLFPLTETSSTRFSLLLFTLYVISPFFIQIDRTAWNPNPLFAGAACIFFPTIHGLFTKKFSLKMGLFVAFGAWLGYQAHFSIFLLPPILFIFAILFRSKTVFFCFLSSCLGVLIGVIPTILYDYKHQWQIFHGLVSFLTGKNDSGGPLSERFGHTLMISLENLEKIVYTGISTPLMYLVGLGVLALNLYRSKTNQFIRRFTMVSVLWIILVALLYAFYRGLTTPEYYFIVQFPAILVLTALLFERLPLKWQGVLLTSWSLFIIVWFAFDFVHSRAFTLGTQVKVALEVQQHYSPQNTKLIFDMEHINQIGFYYLLSLPQPKMPESTHEIHISYPTGANTLVTKQIGDIAIWDDTRTDAQKNYLIVGNVMLQTPKEIKLLAYGYPDSVFPQIHSFIIEKDHQNVGRIWLYPPNSHLQDQQIDTLIKLIQTQGSLNLEVGDWKTFQYADQKNYWVSPYMLNSFIIAEIYDPTMFSIPEQLLREIKILQP